MSSDSSAFLTEIGSAFAETKPAAPDLALDISLIEAKTAHVTGKNKGKKKGLPCHYCICVHCGYAIIILKRSVIVARILARTSR